ncbi:MAG: Txe/YoeB family addiction module toxin [Ignavibacteria bacterium]|nr:Txe/YoeB family addiction module toxin [Ignavibacteria bacterium]
MKNITFHPDAFKEFIELSTSNLKLFKKIGKIIFEIQRDPFKGLFKPEPLKFNLQGCWSRRINDEHRLVYKVTEESIIIISSKFHY